MSDIITRAKELLDGATPGPWTAEIESSTENEGGDFSLQAAILAEGEPLMRADDGMVYHKEGNFGLAAAAPGLAQALAEETYFYGVQVWMGGRWIMMLTRDHGTGITHRGKWFEHKHEAEEYAATWNHDTPTRIVRQRRSSVEAISE